MLRIVPHTVPRVGRSYEHFPDGIELHLLQGREASCLVGVSHERGDPVVKAPLYAARSWDPTPNLYVHHVACVMYRASVSHRFSGQWE